MLQREQQEYKKKGTVLMFLDIIWTFCYHGLKMEAVQVRITVRKVMKILGLN
jgi:hypothetical protein